MEGFKYLGLHCFFFLSVSQCCIILVSRLFIHFIYLFICLVDDPEAPQCGHLLRLHRQRWVWKDPEAEGRGVPCGRPLLRAERGTNGDLRRLHHRRQQVSYSLSSGESLYRFLRITRTLTHTRMPRWTPRTRCSLTSCSSPFLHSSLFIYLTGLDQHQAILIDC